MFTPDATDGHIPGWYVIDGRNEMAWPHEYGFFTIIPGDADFHAEKVDLAVPPDRTVNYVTLAGNLTDVTVQGCSEGQSVMRELFTVPAGDHFLYSASVEPVRGSTIRIPFTKGYGTPPGFEGDISLPLSGAKRIHEVGLYHVTRSDKAPEGTGFPITETACPLEGRA